MYETSACDKISEILSDLLEMFVPIPMLPESPDSEMKNEISYHKLYSYCIRSIPLFVKNVYRSQIVVVLYKINKDKIVMIGSFGLLSTNIKVKGLSPLLQMMQQITV